MSKAARNIVHLIFSLAVVLAGATASAQLTTATLSGTIADTTGAVVPHAKVTIVNVDTHYTVNAVADDAGYYHAELLPIGHYSVSVQADGFQKFVQNNITLSVNDQARIDAKLDVGSSSQEITVNDAPPAVNLENATVGRTISTTEVEDLPILDRNIYNLLPLVPGVQSQTNGNTLGFPQEVVQINGSTTESNTGAVTYYLDGGLDMTAIRMTGNQMPNPEALAQFNVQTSNYNAAYGRMSSGVVSAVTKSGTNQFHGTVYEFHRETNFNSYPWHIPSTVAVAYQPRPAVHRNFFGGVIGGPIVRDRTFFFFDYSRFQDIENHPFTGAAVLPTSLESMGNFSQFLPTTSGAIKTCGQTLSAADKANGDFIVCSPTTRLPYSGNVITDPLDPTAVNILKSLPAANAGTALTPSYIGSVPLPAHYNEYMGKIDHQLSDKQRLFGSYFYLTGLNTIFAGGGNLPWETQLQEYSLDVANLSDTITLSPNKVNQVWATYTLSRGGRVNSNTNSLASFGSNFVGQGPLSLPNITVTNYFTLSNAIQGPKAQTNFYSVRDLFIWNVGKHNLQIGGEASLNKDITVSDLNNYGTYSFTSSTSARSGNALSDYMLGLLNTETQDAPVTSLDNSFFYSAFVEDDWRVAPRLTINAGLRWDIQTPPTDPQNKLSTFVQGQQSTVNPLMPRGELVVGDAGVTRGIVALRIHNISPRLGFAWDAFGNGKTSVRAGAGIFYGGVSGNEWNTPSGAYPFTLRYTFGVPGTLSSPYKNTPSPFPFTYTAGKVAAAPAGTSLSVTAENFQWPQTYQMNASVQQEITKSFVVGIAYVGALARRLVYNPDINYPIFNTATPTANTTTNVNARRPIDTGVLGSIAYANSIGTSNYNAMQVTFSKQMRHGIGFNGYYAWTKTLNSYNFDSTAAPEDADNLKFEKGAPAADQRNIFVTSVVWQPDYVHNHRYIAAALNHWKVTPIIKLYSGFPFSVTTGVDSNADGQTTDRANQTGNPYDSTINHKSRAAEVKRFFDTSAFCGYTTANPTACPGIGPGGSDGSSQRNGYFGPGSKDVDLAILRDFPINNRLTFELRGEASNVFNFVNLSNPNSAINLSSTTDQITSAGQMREIQVGGRLTF
jgi:hypothetical protein